MTLLRLKVEPSPLQRNMNLQLRMARLSAASISLASSTIQELDTRTEMHKLLARLRPNRAQHQHRLTERAPFQNPRQTGARNLSHTVSTPLDGFQCKLAQFVLGASTQRVMHRGLQDCFDSYSSDCFAGTPAFPACCKACNSLQVWENRITDET